MAVIQPTPGRIVWFFPTPPDSGRVRMHDPTAPLAAIITAAKSDTLVNLCVFDAEGSPLGFQNVQLLQDDAEPTLDKEG